ncbi:hypothetical protein [[Flexibacter] sp. ATCC 35208]|uniref:hypothetical protein n=1 Tax=[Flexibacter] sp. ATCC 35208 TaxID=1936242 RepID=UPI0009D045AC|nr:hypothetical protein [[Flexibacter] sp. ATCC 35208]OMP80632.1 hypothetical protein BW716_03775 [[Flexibacter] sp. ATCC 35208]
MKTLFLSAAALFMVVMTSEANSFDKVVSNLSKTQFSQDFSHVQHAVWSHPGNFDEVIFQRQGHTMTAYYDAGSELVGTTSSKKFTDLPLKAQSKIRKEYQDYNVVSVIRYDDNENNGTDMQLFGVTADAPDSYFVELSKGAKKEVLQVSDEGNVSFFQALK